MANIMTIDNVRSYIAKDGRMPRTLRADGDSWMKRTASSIFAGIESTAISRSFGFRYKWRKMISYPMLRGAILHYGIRQSMNSAGGRCHDNARCESIWPRMKSELLYGRYDTKKMTTKELT